MDAETPNGSRYGLIVGDECCVTVFGQRVKGARCMKITSVSIDGAHSIRGVDLSPQHGYNRGMNTAKKAHQKSTDFWANATATVNAYEAGTDPVALMAAKLKASRDEKIIEV